MKAMITRYLDGMHCHDPQYKLPTMYVFAVSLMLGFADFVPAVGHYICWTLSFFSLMALGVGDV